MLSIDRLSLHLRHHPRRWAITGVAGFIGHELARTLLDLGQSVIGLDNFVTGEPERVDGLRTAVYPDSRRFDFIEGDIRDRGDCARLCRGADYVLHEAALISVAESMDEPAVYNDVNVSGFLNVCTAAREARVRRVVLASSCAVYGDTEPIVKAESSPTEPISPYGLTKLLDEQYAALFTRTYRFPVVALRYFNVYGAGQKPGGAYGAVIPRWIDAILDGRPCPVFGDGAVTRDYVHVRDVVQANLLAATVDPATPPPLVFNIGSGRRVSLLQLHRAIQEQAAGLVPGIPLPAPIHLDARPGDILHVGADVSAARDRLGYHPTHPLDRGIRETLRASARAHLGGQAAPRVPAVARR